MADSTQEIWIFVSPPISEKVFGEGNFHVVYIYKQGELERKKKKRTPIQAFVYELN